MNLQIVAISYMADSFEIWALSESCGCKFIYFELEGKFILNSKVKEKMPK
jgi:hypothetical protein